MKVGTDAVLLGAWASGNHPSDILEVGTGCGLISLMMAQRFPRAEMYSPEYKKLTFEFYLAL